MLDVRRPTHSGIVISMELFHVMNRGVDGRAVFMDASDRARFVHDLYEFNDTAPAEQFSRTPSSLTHVGRQTSNMGPRDRIVDIHGWKLVSNHFHLILSERVENGLSLFLQKLSGYARYFNERHKRHGPLFQGGKKILIEREEHFLYILHYVHLNALDDLHEYENWRERDKGGVPNLKKALEHLKNDRWSSYLDYCGVRNFPSILTKTLFEERSGEYQDSLIEFIKDRTFQNLGKATLE